MLSLSPDNQPEVIRDINGTSSFLDDILNVNNPYFHHIVRKIYPTEHVRNKTNSSDITSSFLDLNISISDGTINTKIYDKREDFNFNIVNFRPCLDGYIPNTMFS